MEVTAPSLNDKQREVAKGIIYSKAKYHTVKASRQSGKTYLLGRLAMLLSLTEECFDEAILVVSPTYEQVKLIFDYVNESDEYKKVIKSVKASAPYEIINIYGCKIKFKSADRSQNIRGGSYKVVIADEFAFFKTKIFDSVIVPTTASKKRSKIIVASTPYGKGNDFHKLYVLGEKTTPATENYAAYSMHYSDNPLYDENEVIAAKLRLPLSVFLEEYEGEFSESNGDVFNSIVPVSVIEMYNNDYGNVPCVAGIDWGCRTDSSVVTILDLKGETLFIKELKGGWTEQFESLSLILNKYNPITYAESNGVGDPMISRVQERYPNIQEFLMTQDTKATIIETLRYDIETNAIRLPKQDLCPDLHYQMNRFTYHKSSNGKISYHHRPGENDDYVDSLAIANFARHQHSIGFNIPTTNSDSFIRSLDYDDDDFPSYYN